MLKAKKEGKVRFPGFTGHKDPDSYNSMLETGLHFDAVQMPINSLDANFQSFEKKTLPRLNQQGIAVLAMKPIGGHGEPVEKGVFTAAELLRYSMSMPVSTTIAGASDLSVLEKNPKTAQSSKSYSEQEMQALRDRAKSHADDGRFELYKTPIEFDNPEARIAHSFSFDLQQIEVRQMPLPFIETHPFTLTCSTVVSHSIRSRCPSIRSTPAIALWRTAILNPT